MSAAFTPGPWWVDRKTDRSANILSGTEYFSAEIVAFTGATCAEEKANAHLIAAAPELYEVAKSALEQMELAGIVHVGDAFAGAPILNELRAALAKARGQS